ncbi:MAG: cobyrinate a,c-diamide synthase [Ferrovum sp.]|nr:cobyrinate a,c-diamide synthase [Ferrovum sp.]
MAPRPCPALFLSAPSSGQGKTTLTAGLARYHRNQGRNVRVFKAGPDFLDPMILEQASGHAVYSLDLWMTGETDCRQRLYDAALDADLILVEGVMGLFDGTPSSADLAQVFGIPIVAIIDASSMAQTFAAIAYGLRSFRPELPFYGVLANRVASARHAEMLAQALPKNIPLLGHWPRNSAVSLPERHLGLVQAIEIENLEVNLEAAGELIKATGLINLPPATDFSVAHVHKLPQLLSGIQIAIAHDAAFNFIYPANIECLRLLGADLTFFSPLADAGLPPADAVYLPGGYPELHLERLEKNQNMKASLQAHCRAGKPIYAECGGMLYILDKLTDASGATREMVGLLPGAAAMQTRLAGLGMRSLQLPNSGRLRGHTFHYSTMKTSLAPWLYARDPVSDSAGEPVYRHHGILASYLHAYFPSDVEATARLFLP